ncbi:hypothetical protein CFOL_v3_15572, partial [Cephalotus follicularis]
AIWDCGSPLYDSFELTTLSHLIEQHLMTLPSPGGSTRLTHKVSRPSNVITSTRIISNLTCTKYLNGCSSTNSNFRGFVRRKLMNKHTNKKGLWWLLYYVFARWR